jgi:hypothetical protein
MGNQTMKNWKLVSFCTADNAYKKIHEDHLLKSVSRLDGTGIEHKPYYIASRGSWLNNIALKPEVIKMAMAESNQNIFYLDADAELRRYPTLIDDIPLQADFAFHILDHKTWYGVESDRKEIFNGTLYLRNNNKVRLFINEWIQACKAMPRLGEHYHFEQIILKRPDLYKVYELPIEYAYITSLPDGRLPLVKVADPVVCHYQASREWRKKLGK